jgi:hypothetical protein
MSMKIRANPLQPVTMGLAAFDVCVRSSMVQIGVRTVTACVKSIRSRELVALRGTEMCNICKYCDKYRVIQEERSILWEIVIERKKFI